MKLLWNSHGEWPKGSLETHCGKTCHLWGVIRNVFWQNVSPMTTDWRHINLEMDFFYPHWDMSRVSNKDFLHSDPSTLRPLIRSYLCCRGIYGRSTRKWWGEHARLRIRHSVHESENWLVRLATRLATSSCGVVARPSLLARCNGLVTN